MNPPPPPEPPELPPEPEPSSQPLATPLILAFLPSGLILLLLAVNVLQKANSAGFVVAAVATLGCCVASSIMLFKRKATLAIVFGTLLALLNLMIALALGCASLF